MRAWRSAAARAAGLRLPPRPPEAELRPRGRRHSRERDARSVRHHYDLPPEFFALFLGPSLTYSCAVFSRGATTLEEAQETKLEMVCTKLDLHEGQRVLDIGCGWGSFALHAAQRHGVHVVGITLSPPQAEAGQRRAAELGLSDRVDLRVADYRELTDEPFDAVASIGMVEHVGANQIDVYARQVARMVKPGGRVLNHGIARLRHSDPEAGAVLGALRLPRRRPAAPVAYTAGAGAGRDRHRAHRGPRERLRRDAQALGAQPRRQPRRGHAARGSGAHTRLAPVSAGGPARLRERLHVDLPGARATGLTPRP